MSGKIITKKLIISIILFSSIITLILTGIQLYNDYNNELSSIHGNINDIQLGLMGTLSSNLWLDDKEELTVAVRGIDAVPGINYVAIYANEKVYIESGTRKTNDAVTRKIPVEYLYNQKIQQIGELYIEADLSLVHQRLLNRFWIILASNAFKSLVVAIFMFILIDRIIIHKLEHILRFIHAKEENKPRIAYLNQGNAPLDEIDEIAQALNLRQDELENYVTKLEKSEETTRSLLASTVKAKEKIEAASNAKTEFLSRMSHELRTPMNAILGFGQLLQMDKSLNHSQLDCVKEIVSSGEHLLQLINEVLDLSRIESGKLYCSPQQCSAHSIITECLTMSANLADKHNIQLNNLLDADNIAEVYADPVRLKQVILNLINNAIIYNSPKGRVSVKATSMDSGRLRITVSDTGVGLSKVEQERIFQPFERLEKFQGIDGTGIGLSICKSLVIMMDGDIGVNSEEGKGSDFWVEVPQLSLEPASP